MAGPPIPLMASTLVSVSDVNECSVTYVKDFDCDQFDLSLLVSDQELQELDSGMSSSSNISNDVAVKTCKYNLCEIQNMQQNKNRILLNVRGVFYETMRHNLESKDDTFFQFLVRNVKPYTHAGRECYFLDRDRTQFDVIINHLSYGETLPGVLPHKTRDLEV